MEFLKSSQDVTAEDISSFEEFAADESKKFRQQLYDWRGDDPSLPEGWSYKNVATRRFFLSPGGERQFASRR